VNNQYTHLHVLKKFRENGGHRVQVWDGQPPPPPMVFSPVINYYVLYVSREKKSFPFSHHFHYKVTFTLTLARRRRGKKGDHFGRKEESASTSKRRGLPSTWISYFMSKYKRRIKMRFQPSVLISALQRIHTNVWILLSIFLLRGWLRIIYWERIAGCLPPSPFTWRSCAPSSQSFPSLRSDWISSNCVTESRDRQLLSQFWATHLNSYAILMVNMAQKILGDWMTLSNWMIF